MSGYNSSVLVNNNLVLNKRMIIIPYSQMSILKNLNKQGNCSKCIIVLTQDNYKRGRTVCKLCYNKNVLAYYKNKFCPNSSLKTDDLSD